MKKMKKISCILLALAMLCTMSVGMTGCRIEIGSKNGNDAESTSSDVSDVSSQSSVEQNKFTKEDAGFEGVTLGMTMDEVREILGEPYEINENEYSSGLDIKWTYGEHYDYVIDFMKINGSDEYLLSTIYICEENIKLNNGLQVGSSFDEVVGSFYNDGQKREVDFDMIFGDAYENASGYYLYGDAEDDNETQCAYVMFETYDLNDYTSDINYYYIDVIEENGEIVGGYTYYLSFSLNIVSQKVRNIYISYDYVGE